MGSCLVLKTCISLLLMSLCSEFSIICCTESFNISRKSLSLCFFSALKTRISIRMSFFAMDDKSTFIIIFMRKFAQAHSCGQKNPTSSLGFHYETEFCMKPHLNEIVKCRTSLVFLPCQKILKVHPEDPD